MIFRTSPFRSPRFVSAAALVFASLAFAQQRQGGLQGQIADASGAIIPGARVIVDDGSRSTEAVATNEQGAYSLNGLAPGRYRVRVSWPGFERFEDKVDVVAGRIETLNVTLQPGLPEQEITVQAEERDALSVEPAANASAIVITGADLEALPDDPDDLAEDLKALAGPSAGPNGAQIFVDGFTTGRLPSKESIREIRINQNPFSAEYDKVGFERIEIFTKPGADKFHGRTFFDISDAALNSRNPFSSNKPAFQSRQYGGNLSGPISQRASFFVDLERRDIDDNAVINARILDPDFQITPLSEAIITPKRRTHVSPRFDYQWSANHTLVGRYAWLNSSEENAGVGRFSLLSRAYNTENNEHTVRLTETDVLSATAVNETRFQYVRNNVGLLGDNSVPTVLVLDAFTGGGAQIGRSFDKQDRYELQNCTTISRGRHSIKFGGRVRTTVLENISPQDFGGTFVFSGGFGPQLDANNQVIRGTSGQPVLGPITSIEQYRRTLLFQREGLTMEQIRALGGGASQFTISGGIAAVHLTQADAGLFMQDDWRVRPNFTLSAGLRYETQNHIHDRVNFGPRLGFVWAPGARSGRPGKTVIRAGSGVFYDRFSESLTLQAIRFNGQNQHRYIVSHPKFFPNAPPSSSFTGMGETVRHVDANLHAPYLVQSAVGIEHQLPFKTTISTTFINSHGVHLLGSRNINAPLPGAVRDPSNSAAKPYGEGNIFLYESDGILNQNQIITNLNTRVTHQLTLFTVYVYQRARSDTDGADSFPANQYNLRSEYGRTSTDIRHRFVLGGSAVATPLRFRFSPFIIARTGEPFNITSGLDSNGDTLFTDRPALATDLHGQGVVITRFGAFNLRPKSGEAIIPRNYGDGPAFFTVNLRLSRTFGFGGIRGDGRGSRGSMRSAGSGSPGGMAATGFHGLLMDPATEHRYNLTFAITVRNLLNTVNAGVPIGNLSSLLFGRSNALASSAGLDSSAANNRRIQLQLRLAF